MRWICSAKSPDASDPYPLPSVAKSRAGMGPAHHLLLAGFRLGVTDDGVLTITAGTFPEVAHIVAVATRGLGITRSPVAAGR